MILFIEIFGQTTEKELRKTEYLWDRPSGRRNIGRPGKRW
jgi:hypothetical protein